MALPDSFPHHILVPSCQRPSAKRRRRRGGHRRIKPRSRRCSTQGAAEYIREYELIWLLQQRLRAVSWPHYSACAACISHSTAQPWHGTCPAVITLTRRSLSVSQALHVLSSCILYCLAPPAVDLLEALGRCVCTRRACCFCLRISHFCCFR